MSKASVMTTLDHMPPAEFSCFCRIRKYEMRRAGDVGTQPLWQSLQHIRQPCPLNAEKKRPRFLAGSNLAQPTPSPRRRVYRDFPGHKKKAKTFHPPILERLCGGGIRGTFI